MLKAKNVLKKDFGKTEFQCFKQDHFAAVALQPPFNKPAADAKFADIPGWGSGSKVQAGHFLTLNVIFRNADVKDLCGGPLGIPKRILTKTAEKMAKYEDWINYLEDIEKCQIGSGGIRNPYLGVFTSTREAQLRIIQSSKKSTSRPETRSGDGHRSPSPEGKHKRCRINASADTTSRSPSSQSLMIALKQPEDISGIAQKLAGMSLHDNYAAFGSNISTTRQHLKEISAETDTSIGASAIFENHLADPAASADPAQSQISEDSINASLISLLSDLSLPVKTPLQWSLDKPRFRFCKNQAELLAITDGKLSGNSGLAQFPYSIVEVKPYLLRSPNFGPLMRQIGLEMVTWIRYCHMAKRPQGR